MGRGDLISEQGFWDNAFFLYHSDMVAFFGLLLLLLLLLLRNWPLDSLDGGINERLTTTTTIQTTAAPNVEKGDIRNDRSYWAKERKRFKNKRLISTHGKTDVDHVQKSAAPCCFYRSNSIWPSRRSTTRKLFFKTIISYGLYWNNHPPRQEVMVV
jgi:hypothetical protein